MRIEKLTLEQRAIMRARLGMKRAEQMREKKRENFIFSYLEKYKNIRRWYKMERCDICGGKIISMKTETERILGTNMYRHVQYCTCENGHIVAYDLDE